MFKTIYKSALIAILILYTSIGLGQALLPVVPNYFSYPIMPGSKSSLTGNMGEIRGNHFHGGLDIRTRYQTGLPVYAAAEGYISKVVVESQGYGWMVVIRHPNGYQTVYAHLEDFYLPLAQYVRQEQYRREQFAVELNMKPEQFPVRRGDIIGYSGNTGSSGGPHLHWEIRDTTEGFYNPLLYGFNEVFDNKDPYVVRLAVRPISENARVNGVFEREEFNPVKQGRTYVINKPIPVFGTIALEMWAHDRLNDGSQRAGLHCTEVMLDGKTVFYRNTTYISKPQQKQINHHINYESFFLRGERFEKLYFDDGNVLRQYKKGALNGYIQIADSSLHFLEVIVSDPYGNLCRLSAKLKGTPPKEKRMQKVNLIGKPKFKYKIVDNFLKTTVSNLEQTDSLIAYYIGKEQRYARRAYHEGEKAVFLYDLRKGLPDSCQIRGIVDSNFSINAAIYPSVQQTIRGEYSFVTFDKNALFDTAYVSYEEDSSDMSVRIGNPLIPFQYNATLCFPLAPELDKTHLGIYQISDVKGSARWVGNYLVNNELRGRIKQFGKYKILSDTKPPVIKHLKSSEYGLLFRIGDNLSGIKSWRATLNGKFLLLSFEHKKSLLYSTKLNPSDPLQGELVVELTDNANNTAVFRTVIR